MNKIPLTVPPGKTIIRIADASSRKTKSEFYYFFKKIRKLKNSMVLFLNGSANF